MELLELTALPEDLQWENKPENSDIIARDGLCITAGQETDWFFDPDGSVHKHNAPVALFPPPDENFVL